MKKIGKITIKKDETLSDKELSAISDAIRTDCGSSYFYMDGIMYCHHI